MNDSLFKTNESLIVLFFACLNVCIHLVFFGNFEYHRDELLYFSLAFHPDFGYASIPPFTAWIAFVTNAIFGSSLFAVKLFPAILSGIFTAYLGLIVKEFGGKIFATALVMCAVVLMPFSLRVFHLFQPVALDLFFWTAFFFYLIRYINSKDEKYLIVLGIISGMGMMNKYLFALLIISVLIALSTSVHKDIFKKRKLYIGFGVSLILFSPNLLWQITHNYPVIEHLTALNSSQLVNVNRISFLIDQMTMPFAFSLVIVFGLASTFFDKKFKFIGAASLLVLVILISLRGKSYYSMGILPVLLAYGSVQIEKLEFKSYFKWSILGLLILLSIPMLPFGIPIYSEAKMVRYFKNLEEKYGLVLGRTFEDGSVHSLPQDYADQLGWEELTSIVNDTYQRIQDKNKVLIYAENYGQAGAIEVIGKKYDLPQPVCFSDNFIYWVPLKFDTEIETLIYINDELGADIDELFENIENKGQISNTNAREYGTTVYLCTKPKYRFGEFWDKVMVRIGKVD